MGGCLEEGAREENVSGDQEQDDTSQGWKTAMLAPQQGNMAHLVASDCCPLAGPNPGFRPQSPPRALVLVQRI